MIRDHMIIFFPLVDWEGPWQRYQHLAFRFSTGNRVIYINSPAAITYVMKSPFNLMKKWFGFVRGKKKVNSNLVVYYPPPCLPFERSSRWVNRVNQYILFLYIKIFVKPKGRMILWVNDPYKYLMIKLLRPKIAVYDCPDAIVFEDSKKKQKVYDELKKRVLQESTVSLFTSKALLEEGKAYGKNCFYVPNGVDTESFIRKTYGTPKDIGKLSGTILGVVGTFDERIDVNLLEYTLESIQEAKLVLVGPIHTHLKRLGRNSRVFLAGKRRYEEVPAFINKFDVALIPYFVNKITEAVYPVKLHEYLVLGKPVVSTDLPEVRQFADVLWIANTEEEFVQSIRVALNKKYGIAREKRVKIARENSWDERVNQITKILQTYL